MKKAEKILVSLVTLAVIGKLANVTGFSALVVIGICLLSMFYFVGSYFLLRTDDREKTGMQIAISVVTGIVLSSLLMGILFAFMRWPGVAGMLTISIVPLVAILILSIVKRSSQPVFYKGVMQRIIPGLVIALFMLLFGKELLFKIQYRNYPKLMEATEALEKDPNNRTLRVARDVEYMRMQVNQEQFLNYLQSQAQRDSLYAPHLEIELKESQQVPE